MSQQYQKDAGRLSAGFIGGVVLGIGMCSAVLMGMWLLNPDNWFFEVTDRFLTL